MTSVKRIFFLASLLVLSFASCEYEPEAVNFQNVDSTPIQSIQIALSEIKDTLIVGTWTEVSFELEFPKPVNFTLKILVGTTAIYSSAQHTGSFTISPFELANGFYPLIFEVVAGTGTLSLADRLEVEKVLFQYQGKILHVETSPAQKLEIISVTQHADGLHITWPKYPKVNFTEYILHKVVSPIYRGYSEYGQYEIKDIKQNSFVDTSFVGGQAEYRLQVVTYTDMAFSEPRTLKVDPPTINRVKTLGLNEIEVGWPKSQFSSAFGSYHLLEDYTYGPNDYFTSSTINDTTISLSNFPFGAPIKGELRTQPKEFITDYATSGTYSSFGDIYLGDKIPDEIKVLSVKSADRLYYYKNEYLYVMRHSEKKPYDSLAITLNISQFGENMASAQSPDGQYFYVSAGQNLVRLDAITLDEISSIPLDDVLNEPDVFPFAIAVNNNNRLVVDVRQQANKGAPLPLYFSDYIAIIDGNSTTVSDTIRNITDALSIQTSADQRYVYVNTYYSNRIFEISSAGVELRRAEMPENSLAQQSLQPVNFTLSTTLLQLSMLSLILLKLHRIHTRLFPMLRRLILQQGISGC